LLPRVNTQSKLFLLATLREVVDNDAPVSIANVNEACSETDNELGRLSNVSQRKRLEATRNLPRTVVELGLILSHIGSVEHFTTSNKGLQSCSRCAASAPCSSVACNHDGATHAVFLADTVGSNAHGARMSLAGA
jgi:hypothetical protein